jgi:hypothetical protein
LGTTPYVFGKSLFGEEIHGGELALTVGTASVGYVCDPVVRAFQSAWDWLQGR